MDSLNKVSAPCSIPELVRSVDADTIRLPVLRELTREVQTRSAAALRQENSHWSDTDWKQWRQHSNHNPW